MTMLLSPDGEYPRHLQRCILFCGRQSGAGLRQSHRYRIESQEYSYAQVAEMVNRAGNAFRGL